MFTLSVAANPLAEREREMYKNEFIEQITNSTRFHGQICKIFPSPFVQHTARNKYLCVQNINNKDDLVENFLKQLRNKMVNNDWLKI
jgi:hypothetical protein